ncbi:hypothetical protein PCANC_15506 [Puccinia coronata f. sp. avenae]|uniref:Uncharacterized protein n=1 Tax=Puccinia coronata f. sp. avenae TaxID=200324 RepID=A0A2N5UFU3_9BASI|nr:hypothetical protein PCANC_17064 [Puccinia coronata f. sp. avenae]PLW16557.1 hypothetical protein PCASD_16879 [Puccinia coronata f. sp. avenae]PLW31087.1 hypothetical protein PCASD_13530 [Puccinia coronata f. sp. avenae]PLW36580.1 hypothetical protein PCANC_15506 [Puccinia coronata f. sp. avenae]
MGSRYFERRSCGKGDEENQKRQAVKQASTLPVTKTARVVDLLGSREWHSARTYKLTCSRFNKFTGQSWFELRGVGYENFLRPSKTRDTGLSTPFKRPAEKSQT